MNHRKNIQKNIAQALPRSGEEEEGIPARKKPENMWLYKSRDGGPDVKSQLWGFG